MLHAALIFKFPPRSSDYEARGKLYDVGPVEQFMHNNVFLNNKILLGGWGWGCDSFGYEGSEDYRKIHKKR